MPFKWFPCAFERVLGREVRLLYQRAYVCGVEAALFKYGAGLRFSPQAGSQRMLNAIELESPLPIHRHRHSSEAVVCLRGRLVEIFYDELEKAR